MNRGKCSTKNV